MFKSPLYVDEINVLKAAIIKVFFSNLGRDLAGAERADTGRGSEV